MNASSRVHIESKGFRFLPHTLTMWWFFMLEKKYYFENLQKELFLTLFLKLHFLKIQFYSLNCVRNILILFITKIISTAYDESIDNNALQVTSNFMIVNRLFRRFWIVWWWWCSSVISNIEIERTIFVDEILNIEWLVWQCFRLQFVCKVFEQFNSNLNIFGRVIDLFLSQCRWFPAVKDIPRFLVEFNIQVVFRHFC